MRSVKFTIHNSQFTLNSQFSFTNSAAALKIVNCKLITASEGGV
jgi:hypothetical protein